MKGMLVAITVLFLVGCASSVPVRPVLETPGLVSEVVRHESRTTTTSPEGTTSSTKESVDATELTPAMAEMKLKLAMIEAKAKADPCRNWFLAPSYCYYGYDGYNSGGNYRGGRGGRHYVTSSGPGGRNIRW